MKRYPSSFNQTYHLVNRGVNSMSIYRTEEDKLYFSCLVKKYLEKYKIKIYAFAFMDNHYHMCVSPKSMEFSDISKFMRDVNLSYVRYYNKTETVTPDGKQRTGTIFESTYKSIPVNSEFQLRTLVRYIHNNPYSMGVDAKTYAWSSYHMYIEALEKKKSCKKGDRIKVDMSYNKFDKAKDLIEFTNAGRNDVFAEGDGTYQGRYYMSDIILYGDIEDSLGIKVAHIKNMEKKEQSEVLFMISLIPGISRKQIARVVGMNYAQVCRNINWFFSHIDDCIKKEIISRKLYKKGTIGTWTIKYITDIARMILSHVKIGDLKL